LTEKNNIYTERKKVYGGKSPLLVAAPARPTLEKKEWKNKNKEQNPVAHCRVINGTVYKVWAFQGGRKERYEGYYQALDCIGKKDKGEWYKTCNIHTIDV
jgi:hypothetical protein